MSIWRFDRLAFGGCVIVALLSGCGVSQPPLAGVLNTGSDAARNFSHHHTFHFTGTKQSFIVPAGVTTLKIVALGAAGEITTGRARSGRGGRVYALVPVTSRERLYIFVGGSSTIRYRNGKGGYNGGARSGFSGFGGGGASDVREGGDNVADRIIVAGGGGGAGGGNAGDGGNGGGSTGGAGGTAPYSSKAGGGGGGGGTQVGGGVGGTGGKAYNNKRYYGHRGKDGKLGRGGHGADGGPGVTSSSTGLGGGGGGGGYYGGGGGGGGSGGEGASSGGGGGGGSSYVEPSAQVTHMWRGWKSATGNGLVVISW